MSRHHRPADEDKIFLSSTQYLQVRRRNTYYGEFRMTYNDFLKYVTQQAPDALPILNALIWLGDVQNQTRASHQRIAEEVNKSLPTVSRHMKRLRELGVVINDIDVPYACYRLHPLIAWRGKVEERNHYIEGLGRDHPFTRLIEQLTGDEEESDSDEDD